MKQDNFAHTSNKTNTVASSVFMISIFVCTIKGVNNKNELDDLSFNTHHNVK